MPMSAWSVTPIRWPARSVSDRCTPPGETLATPACVGFVSRQMVDAGLRCVLYTDLDNPTSNSVYRSLGYRAISENVRYEFGSTPDT